MFMKIANILHPNTADFYEMFMSIVMFSRHNPQGFPLDFHENGKAFPTQPSGLQLGFHKKLKSFPYLTH